MITLFNDKFINNDKAIIGINSKALIYGLGIFETLRTYNKKVFKLVEHIDRLFGQIKLLEIELKYSKTEIIKMVEKVLQKNTNDNLVIKIIAIEEGIIITSRELDIDNAIYAGVALKSINCTRYLPKAKMTSYATSFIPHRKANKEGFYDALLVDKNNFVTEGAYCNIFWFEDDVLCTTEKNIFPGITRQTVIDISKHNVVYKEIKLDELITKKEIFLTQTTTGIVPVIEIDNHTIGNGTIGKKTKKILILPK